MGVKSVDFTTMLPNGQRQNLTHYRFDNAGDEIPMHVHDHYHSTCCVRGRCKVYDRDGKSAEVEAGRYVEFQAGRHHAIQALEAGTEIINVREPGARR